MNTTYTLLCRFLVRCAAICSEPAVHPIVKRMYEDMLATLATTFLTAHAAVQAAGDQASAARVIAAKALAQYDQPFRLARSVFGGRVPEVTVPGTLKDQATSTERQLAIQALLALVQARRGEPWADELLASPFGALAPDVLTKLAASISADRALAAAMATRAEAAEPAYQAYLLFKDTVRQEPGPANADYRKLCERIVATSAPAPTPDPVVVPPDPPVVVTTTPTNGASAPSRSS